MLKNKLRYICTSCDFINLGYLGKCPNCESWNTFVQNEIESKNQSGKNAFFDSLMNDGDKLKQPDLDDNFLAGDEKRSLSGFKNLDAVLGGGLVQGSVILLAGEPGIGKSTLLLQLGHNMAKNNSLLYISAEESIKQIALRAKRLSINNANLKIKSLENLEEILALINTLNPDTVIIDSIQTIYNPSILSSPGTINQVRESSNLIIRFAKAKNITVILVGHVTKDGYVAGPKVLEHSVDVVLQFENYNLNNLRVIKSIKNRFGPTSDLVMFNMETTGLSEVLSPSKYLLEHRISDNEKISLPIGSIITVTGKGNNSMLMEVQALATQTFYPNPKRVVNGFDYNRMLQIIAVLEKQLNLNLSKFDIYVNIVGGLDINDTSGDVGVALSIISSYLNKAISPMALAIGEIGLTGEIRSIGFPDKILKEASALGLSQAIIPRVKNLSHNFNNFKINQVSNIKEAFNVAFEQ